MPKTPSQTSYTQDSAFTMTMTDDALVTFTGVARASSGVPGAAGFDPGALSFIDQGYMPVNSLTLGGNPLHLPSGFDGMFIHYYNGIGVQDLQSGAVDYTSLHYELVGYTGQATVSRAADGTPTVSGTLRQVVLAQGDLIPASLRAGNGHLAFDASGGIGGQMDVTVQMGGKTVGELDIQVSHKATDISPAFDASGHQTGIKLDNGSLVATFVPLTGG